jgi:hypothetical protein
VFVAPEQRDKLRAIIRHYALQDSPPTQAGHDTQLADRKNPLYEGKIATDSPWLYQFICMYKPLIV